MQELRTERLSSGTEAENRLRVFPRDLALGLLAGGLLCAAISAVATDAVAQSPADLAEAKAVFASRCAMCHGVAGAGDGVAAAGLTPKPRDLSLAAWQGSVTDDHIATVITKGGPAVGLSPLMPAHADVAAKPMVMAALVQHVRGFGAVPAPAQPAAGEAPAAGGAPAAPASPAPVPAEARVATDDDIERGLNMFQGRVRFSNSGPACNSCHHVKNDAVIGGGVLAKELTSVFSTMGAPGVQAILGRPPFPVMEQAYSGKGLTDDEIFSVVAFLEHADAEQAFQQPRDYGVKLFVSGVVGVFVLLGTYAVLWPRRKKLSVNHDIYERQVKTI